jgi:hypothetical protein
MDDPEFYLSLKSQTAIYKEEKNQIINNDRKDITHIIDIEFGYFYKIYKIGICCFSAKDPPGTGYLCHYLYSLVFTGNGFF